MNGYRKAGIAILGGFAVFEIAAAAERFSARKKLFAEAASLASRTGRQLVVIGDPDAGTHTRMMRAYGCGDLCIDLNGCPSCPSSISADITLGLPRIADDSSVVFISCVLEYVDDPRAAMAEISRIAGNPKNIFNVNVQPWCATACFYPSAKNFVSGDVHAPAFAPVSASAKLAWVGLAAVGVGLVCYPKK